MNKSESALNAQAGKHLEAFIYRVPKKNHDAVVKNLKKFIPWFEKEGVGLEYFRFGEGEIMESMESLAKTLSVSDDEEIWMELQYFRDLQHCKEVYARMMQDKEMEPAGTEFFGLIAQGKPLVSGGFSRLE
jgi:uncharacterized protein YbaA (DUF1428 family)